MKGDLVKWPVSLPGPKLFTAFCAGAEVDFIDIYGRIMGIRCPFSIRLGRERLLKTELSLFSKTFKIFLNLKSFKLKGLDQAKESHT